MVAYQLDKKFWWLYITFFVTIFDNNSGTCQFLGKRLFVEHFKGSVLFIKKFGGNVIIIYTEFW